MWVRSSQMVPEMLTDLLSLDLKETVMTSIYSEGKAPLGHLIRIYLKGEASLFM